MLLIQPSIVKNFSLGAPQIEHLSGIFLSASLPQT